MYKQIILIIFTLTLYHCSAPKVIDDKGISQDAVSKSDFYNVFNCEQLYSEARRVSDRINELADEYGGQTAQSRLRFFGSVLYWPILLLNDGQSSKELRLEYARQEKRINTINRWLEQKECSLINS